MIISPPFLPAASNSEDAWLDTAMAPPPSRLASTLAPEGSFPLSNELCWHNGVHIKGTLEANGECTVRAIADGVVVFASPPSPRTQDPKHVQNLNPFGTAPSWTDNGCVIIKHSTEIGAKASEASEIVFYSVYMHLSRLGQTPPTGSGTRPWQKDDKIWRKAPVGQAGMVYGESQRCHFEICMDDAQLERLIGHAPSWVDPALLPTPTGDGRIDAVFGAMWIYLRKDTPTRPAASPPTSHLRGNGQGTLEQALWVKMSYESGGCVLETFDTAGQSLGRQISAGFEYDLYHAAHERHHKLPPVDQAKSSPSGWYELLRYGRNLGRGPAASDKDPLPAEVAHWREIIGPDRLMLWADLNAEGGFKFSDADFLPIQGWNFVDDDSTPDDQRCDSARLKELIADPDKGKVDRLATDTLAKRLSDDKVRKKLRRLVCRFPSELQRETIMARYGFVKELEHFRKSPEDWSKIQEPHLKALTFTGLDAGYLKAQWHFHPREFIGLMRKCGWLTFDELRKAVPKIKENEGRRFLTPLNLMNRKYLGQQKNRLSHFLGQAAHETAGFSGRMTENGNTKASREFETDTNYYAGPDSYPPMIFGQGYESQNNTLGNQIKSGDGVKFRGRGALQITGRDSYSQYWVYRGWLSSTSFTPNWWIDSRWWSQPQFVNAAQIDSPQRISARQSGNEFNPIDVGGWFWIAKKINKKCDQESSKTTSAPQSESISRIINYYDTRTFLERKSLTEKAKFILADGL